MPSPIGHALGGLAAGWLVAGLQPARAPLTSTRGTSRSGWRPGAPDARQTMLLAAAGMAPDLDLLFGAHSTYTHSVGAVVLTFVAFWFVAARPRRTRVALAVAAAVGSHALLDWLGSDTTPPIGIMALWPFSREFYQSDLRVFMAISRRYWQGSFYTHNAIAALRELAILGPVAALVALIRRQS